MSEETQRQTDSESHISSPAKNNRYEPKFSFQGSGLELLVSDNPPVLMFSSVDIAKPAFS